MNTSAEQTASIKKAMQDEKCAKDEVIRELVEIVAAFVGMVEDSMTGLSHPQAGRFVPGVTDLELRPDGSVKLSDARAALRKAGAL